MVYFCIECSRSYYTAVKLIGQELHPNQHFRCSSNGDYDPIQCIGDNCYCVNTTDGSPANEDGVKMSAVNVTAVSKDTIDCCEYCEMLKLFKYRFFISDFVISTKQTLQK